MICAPALAGEMSAKGTATYTTVSEASDHGGGKLVRTQFKGVVLADDPKSPLNNSAQNCSGTALMGKKGESQTAGYCDGSDADGDVWLISWHGDAKGSEWTFVSGTGKWKNVKGGGKTENVMQAADRSVIKWEGSWSTGK